MDEAQLEEFFRRRIRLMGGYTVKLAPMEAGVPDRLVVFPKGRMFLVELKTRTGFLSPIQKVWHQRMLETWNTRVWVLYGQEDVVEWIRRVVGAHEAPKKPGRKPAAKVG